MFRRKAPVFFGIWIALLFELHGQEVVSGFVYETKTEIPLVGASVFLDGTTIGTTTNLEGYFELKFWKRGTMNLVISHVGHQTLFLESLDQLPDTLFLKPKTLELDEVVLEEDLWSDKKKMKIFLEEFLGKTRAAKETYLLNPEVLVLRYSNAQKTLFAYAEGPLYIQNQYLGYRLNYVMQEFSVIFKEVTTRKPRVERTQNTGKYYFLEIPGPKFGKRRRKAFQGSVLHFMRALRARNLYDENFKVFKGSFQTDPYSVFKLQEAEPDLLTVTVTERELYINHMDQRSSRMKTEGNTLMIDPYGNHLTNSPIFFGGPMGAKRIADLLPLDYEVPPNK